MNSMLFHVMIYGVNMLTVAGPDISRPRAGHDSVRVQSYDEQDDSSGS